MAEKCHSHGDMEDGTFSRLFCSVVFTVMQSAHDLDSRILCFLDPRWAVYGGLECFKHDRSLKMRKTLNVDSRLKKRLFWPSFDVPRDVANSSHRISIVYSEYPHANKLKSEGVDKSGVMPVTQENRTSSSSNTYGASITQWINYNTQVYVYLPSQNEICLYSSPHG